jgi:hypothetical protein
MYFHNQIQLFQFLLVSYALAGLWYMVEAKYLLIETKDASTPLAEGKSHGKTNLVEKIFRSRSCTGSQYKIGHIV